MWNNKKKMLQSLLPSYCISIISTWAEVGIKRSTSGIIHLPRIPSAHSISWLAIEKGWRARPSSTGNMTSLTIAAISMGSQWFVRRHYASPPLSSKRRGMHCLIERISRGFGGGGAVSKLLPSRRNVFTAPSVPISFVISAWHNVCVFLPSWQTFICREAADVHAPL